MVTREHYFTDVLLKVKCLLYLKTNWNIKEWIITLVADHLASRVLVSITARITDIRHLVTNLYFAYCVVNIPKIFRQKSTLNQQECIPVGWVPPARWPHLAACSAPGAGIWSQGGTWCWGYLLWGVPGPGGPCPGEGGACLVRGGVVSQHALRQTSPVDRILDTHFWKYYLAPNFVCGR